MLTLETALRLVDGRSDFVVKRDDRGYVVIDYVYITPDTFADPRRRELRGAKFCPKHGKLIALPFHKFFNVDEKPETQLPILPWHRPHDVLEKLDGSMIHGVILDGRVRLMTRMGLTDTALRCEQLWRHRVEDAWRPHIESGLTPIFEWIGPHNNHIVRYPEDRLVMTALRCMLTGAYYLWEAMLGIADNVGFEVVRRLEARMYGANQNATMELVRGVRSSESLDVEGVVVVWGHSDLRVKIKTEAYTKLHRARDDLSREKDAALLVLEKRVDDVLPLLDAAGRTKLEAYSARMNTSLDILAKALALLSTPPLAVTTQAEPGAIRKSMAIEVLPRINAPIRGAFWKIYDGADPREAVEAALANHCTSGPNWSRVAAELNLPRWTGLTGGNNDVAG